MGDIFRKAAFRPVPITATIATDKEGKTTAKWTPRKAKRSIMAPVRTLADGRQVIEVETGCYYARFRDADGRLRTVSTRCRDESAARQFLAGQERRAERVRVGIMTRREADAAGRLNDPIDDHIDAYIERLPGKRGGLAKSMHRENTRRSLRRLATDCGWTCLADLSRDDPKRWIAIEAATKRPTKADPEGKVPSARSINAHRETVIAFANWCADPNIGRLPANPFGTGRSSVPKADVDADPRRRRALSADELSRLIAAARNAPERSQDRHAEGDAQSTKLAPVRLMGGDRADLWAFLAGTGLRVGEVKQLTVADVRLDAVPPHVRIPAAVAKSRKEQTVPLRSDLAVMMSGRLAGRKPKESIFQIPKALIRRFNADCRRAGIPKRDAEGRTVDIHSLRTTLATHLALTGVAPRVAMELMRHSQIGLTMKVYTDPRLLPLAAAIETTSSLVTKVVLLVTPSALRWQYMAPKNRSLHPLRKWRKS
jgi:integrase